MTESIRAQCPEKGCQGTVTYEPVPNLSGMTGECDTCRAQFRLAGGQTIMIRPPKPLNNGR